MIAITAIFAISVSHGLVRIILIMYSLVCSL